MSGTVKVTYSDVESSRRKRSSFKTVPTIGQTRSEPFSLPEYECAQFKFFHAAVGKLMKAKDSLYASIPEAQPWEGIPTTQNTMPTGEVVENQPLMIESRIVIKWDDIRACNLDALAEQADVIADERLSIVMPHFFRTFEKTCDAAGTGTNAGGNASVYAASKAGLLSMARNLSAELISRGIRVNAVSPGPIATPLYGKLGLSASDLQATSKALQKQIPARRFGQPAEIASAVVFLASDESAFTVGGEIVIDGGLSL